MVVNGKMGFDPNDSMTDRGANGHEWKNRVSEFREQMTLLGGARQEVFFSPGDPASGNVCAHK
jgi:hypothetical protein